MRRCVACLAGWIVLMSTVRALADEPPALTVRVEAGPHDRRDAPLRLELPLDKLPADLAARLPADRPATLWASANDDPASVSVVQVDCVGDVARLTWVLSEPLPAGESRRYTLESRGPTGPNPFRLTRKADGTIDLANRDRTVFRYNAAPASHPNFDRKLARDAYIHPAFTPSGALITGDFSKQHPHHRGFFLAYTKTEVGELHPDFWNIQNGSGRIQTESVDGLVDGSVTARFEANHTWEAGGRGVLNETWTVEAIDVPGADFWLFDLTATQQAVGEPMVLVPYRYGGMAYRGPDSFLPAGVLAVTTSEGRHRVDGDQKPARWVDLTGPIEGDGNRYAGAMIADHPTNLNHPTVARIHPTTLPFFCYVPAHDRRVVIATDAPTTFRYRILIHDGKPDAALDERIWRDFAEPPRVTLGD